MTTEPGNPTPSVVTASDIAAAAQRIGSHHLRTPLIPAEALSERIGAQVAIKAEHRQRTGSFKLRGALNAILSLSPEDRSRGVVTASSGNHGIACATAAGLAGVEATIYLPTGASPAKVAAIGRLGARIVTVDSTDAFQAEVEALAAAEAEGRRYLSPYNDPAIVAGQGTVGMELAADLGPTLDWDRADAVVVAVGGGGLISGVATWLDAHAPGTTVVGASPAVDAAMVASVEAGTVVEIEAEPTFSDGTAGGIEPGAITLELCRRLVGEWRTVSEAEIATAVAAMIDDHHELVEGAAGVALAAAARYGQDHPGARIVVVTCGANVSSTALARMLAVADSSGGTVGPG